MSHKTKELVTYPLFHSLMQGGDSWKKLIEQAKYPQLSVTYLFRRIVHAKQNKGLFEHHEGVPEKVAKLAEMFKMDNPLTTEAPPYPNNFFFSCSCGYVGYTTDKIDAYTIKKVEENVVEYIHTRHCPHCDMVSEQSASRSHDPKPEHIQEHFNIFLDYGIIPTPKDYLKFVDSNPLFSMYEGENKRGHKDAFGLGMYECYQWMSNFKKNQH